MTELLERPFEGLEEGAKFATRGRTLTEADLVQFAALTGDWHPQHTDAEWARRSPFGERVAHGMLLLSYAVGLVPFDPERAVALRRVADATFKRPARPGDTIHVEGTIRRLVEVDETTGLVECDWRILTARGSLVARARVEVVWRREGSAGPDPGSEDGRGAVVPL
jgi:3-hydroxybutyryl-CoA dehydratase